MHNEKEAYGYYEPDNEKELYGYYDIDSDNADKSSTKLTRFFQKHFIGIIITVLLTVFVLAVILPAITVTIQAGERGVLYKRIFGNGVVLDKTYPEGLHFVLPWNIMTRYNIRIQETYDVMTVLSLQGMEVKLELSIRYYPIEEQLPMLHENVGPNYMHTVVIPEVKGIVLSVFGNKDIEQIYTNVYQLIEDANIAVKEDLKEKNIMVDELVVKSIELPETVRNAINEKITQMQISLSYKFRLKTAEQEAQRKTIEAKGIKSFQFIVSEGISDNYLKWKGIDATLKLAESPNSKVVVIGSAKDGLPLILNTDSMSNAQPLRLDQNATMPHK